MSCPSQLGGGGWQGDGVCGSGGQDSGLGQGRADSCLSFALPSSRASALDPEPLRGVIGAPIFVMRKLRLREINRWVQGRTACGYSCVLPYPTSSWVPPPCPLPRPWGPPSRHPPVSAAGLRCLQIPASLPRPVQLLSCAGSCPGLRAACRRLGERGTPAQHKQFCFQRQLWASPEKGQAALAWDGTEGRLSSQHWAQGHLSQWASWGRGLEAAPLPSFSRASGCD